MPKPRLAPSLAVIIVVAFAWMVALLLWSSREVDRISRSRDQTLVSLVIDRTIDRIAHAQESSTVWDDAVRQVRRRPLDMKWLDLNLGTWFKEYASIDEVYIIDTHDRPIYAMRDGKRVIPENYIGIEDVADPMLKLMRTDPPEQPQDASHGTVLLTPGVWDVAKLRGRPAIISVKPIVSDSRTIKQVPGTESLHIAVVYLDDNYFNLIGRNFGLADARYQMTPSLAPRETAVPLRNRHGDNVGYFVWHPFAPGRQVTRYMTPMVLTVLLLSVLTIYALGTRLSRRTRDLEVSRSQAEHQAMHDALTGLANRAMFELRLNQALSFSRRHQTLVALIYIDLDRFKQVNDSHGHPVGDALIRQVGHRLVKEVRGYDIVARLGGDEFAILVTQPEDRAAVERICARIVAELERPFDLSGLQTFISASLGVAIAPEDGLERTEITRKADIALYRAKMEGRGRYVFFSPVMDEAVRDRELANRELRQALAHADEQLRVYYQPICSATTGEITGVEALLRWEHPQQGLIGPTAIIQSAEECGLIEVLGAWVLRKALNDARLWPGLRISVNVSPMQVRNRAFVDTVREILASSALAPELLELEITETALMAQSDDVAGSLRHLRALGVACALDDFGTGYSSLSHIRDIAVDRIKIDRSFVHTIDTGPGSALVEAIVNLARANGMRVTAEGVETRGQFQFLRSIGCHEVQGFLLSRPLPAEAITKMLETADARRLIAVAA